MTESWTCPACKAPVATPFCPNCGESPVRAREHTLKELLVQAVHAFTSMDGKLMRSWRQLVARPGALTAAYLEGQRKAWILPLQLFLITNVVFFAAQALSGVKVFSTTLATHLTMQPWSGPAQTLVARRMEATHRTLEAYAPLFDHAVANHARSLIVLMILPFAALPALLWRKQRRPFAAHATFALHVYSYLLLLLCLASLVIACAAWFAGVNRDSPTLDDVLTIGILVGCALHLFLAIGRAYAARGLARVLQALALTTAIAAIALGYRFAMFAFTLYTT